MCGLSKSRIFLFFYVFTSRDALSIAAIVQIRFETNQKFLSYRKSYS